MFIRWRVLYTHTQSTNPCMYVCVHVFLLHQSYPIYFVRHKYAQNDAPQTAYIRQHVWWSLPRRWTFTQIGVLQKRDHAPKPRSTRAHIQGAFANHWRNLGSPQEVLGYEENKPLPDNNLGTVCIKSISPRMLVLLRRQTSSPQTKTKILRSNKSA